MEKGMETTAMSMKFDIEIQDLSLDPVFTNHGMFMSEASRATVPNYIYTYLEK